MLEEIQQIKMLRGKIESSSKVGKARQEALEELLSQVKFNEEEQDPDNADEIDISDTIKDAKNA
jgi:hypothetical protein